MTSSCLLPLATTESPKKTILTTDSIASQMKAAGKKKVVWKFGEIDYDQIDNEYNAIKSEYAEGMHYHEIVNRHTTFVNRYPTLFRFAASPGSQSPSNDAMVRVFIEQCKNAKAENRKEMDKEASQLSYGLYDKFMKKDGKK